MKKFFLVGILLIILAGCGEDDPVSLDSVDFYTDYNRVTVTVDLENQTDENVFVDVEVDIQDEWLSNQMEDDYVVNINGNEVTNEAIEVGQERYGTYVYFKYELKEKVNERDLKDAVYHNGIEVRVLSESGETLAEETSRHFNYRDNQDSNIKSLFIAMIGIGLIMWVLDKFLRKFLNIRKLSKEEYPKVYRGINGVINFFGSVMLGLIPIFSGFFNFWAYILAFVLLTVIPLVALDLIYLKHTRIYQVHLLMGLFLILIIIIGQQLYPYILY
ncbi:hypothetical protein [Aquisalibacillus elongatus]|uniref:Uncharacterized protein n=1 Tax=Aquisalibacillus elongatus TaxID=485577 RepID=A0A3N5B8N2_9BACI|nr:hypothetical protein [Aquisalibacillus elongatus]RPF53349.1 hypothetical protein EDC24_1847 [Aquisalibacillus elongatus]